MYEWNEMEDSWTQAVESVKSILHSIGSCEIFSPNFPIHFHIQAIYELQTILHPAFFRQSTRAQWTVWNCKTAQKRHPYEQSLKQHIFFFSVKEEQRENLILHFFEYFHSISFIENRSIVIEMEFHSIPKDGIDWIGIQHWNVVHGFSIWLKFPQKVRLAR